MRVFSGVLILLSFSLGAYEAPPMPSKVRSEIQRVCSWCHYQDWFYEDSGELELDKFLAKKDQIIWRLTRPEGDEARMPPLTSPLFLEPGVREEIVAYLRLIKDHLREE